MASLHCEERHNCSLRLRLRQMAPRQTRPSCFQHDHDHDDANGNGITFYKVLSLLLIARNAAAFRLLAPLCPQGRLLHLGGALPQAAHLRGHLGALLLRFQLWHQLCCVPARLLRLHLAALLRHLHQGVNLLVVTLFRALLDNTASSTNFHWEFFTTCVSHKFSRSHLYVPGTMGESPFIPL